MSIKSITLGLISLVLSSSLLGQTSNNNVTVIADISTFPAGALAGKSNEELINLSVAKKIGDRFNPNRDSSSAPRYICTGVKEKNKLVWQFEATDSLTNVLSWLWPGGTYYAAPGDSVLISYSGNKYQFSGKGFRKYKLQYDIFFAKQSIKDPVGHFGGRYINTKEYLTLNKYYNEELDVIIPIVEANRALLNNQEYELLKAYNVYLIEECRLLAFSYIAINKEQIRKGNFSYTPKDLTNIWDSTIYQPWGRWIRSQNFQDIEFGYFERFAIYEIFRELGFIPNNAYLNAALYKKTVYKKIRDNVDYKGVFRERLLCHYLDEEITREIGSGHWFAQSILKDYYNNQGYTPYKNWIKHLEIKRPGYMPNFDAPPFTLTDQYDGKFTHQNTKGKLAIINFWYTGCEECKQTTNPLTKLIDEFKKDTNVVFLNISTDTDKKTWLQSKDAGIYTPKEGIHLYTGGLGSKHEMIKDFNIDKFPNTRYIDAYGKAIVTKPELDLTKDDGLAIADLIRIKMPYMGDGPYVFTNNGKVTAYMISGGNLQEIDTSKFVATTDQYNKQLHFTLQKQLSIQPSEYVMPQKMLVLSDIEGNFTAFRKLLHANKVIDSDFKWTFGNGHLVLAGDMFDRGEQVTECLWLVYSLEESAKAAGGYVHFILGNHEIMNLNGQEDYVKEKYITNYKLLGKTLAEVYNENSELGRWLRTKNIIEKIGDNLFCHGGISPHVNNMPLSLEEINTTARPFYSDWAGAEKSSNENLKILFNARKSPFWYRQYYEKDYFSKSNNEMIHHASESQIDSTCKKFGVNRIITGHTIVADTITVHFGGKVINTDTQHSAGKSEALLIEKNNYYRTRSNGDKILLYRDDKQFLEEVAENSRVINN